MKYKITPGQDLVMVGEAGTYAVRRLLEGFSDKISGRFSNSYLAEEISKLSEQDEAIEQWYNAAREARAGQLDDPVESLIPGYKSKYGVTKVCPVEKGGVLKALWDFCESEALDPETGKKKGNGVGCEFRYDRIPVSQFTTEICEIFDLSPFRLWSENCWIMAMDKGTQFCEDFVKLQIEHSKSIADEGLLNGKRAGFDSEHLRTTEPVKASVFGRFTAEKKRIRVDGAEIAYLTKESYEELDKILMGESEEKK
ncbi:hypothetical protein BXO88_00405 [Oribacterium sp. C9]|uniref:hypothetical protein n=1 Tax=Oribacterium sp. C9 TaxID=1943579 RepID=UPI00098EBED1|nr:hypothetical protein [Oribacterium sp. C9]OON88295.1 hypothetical protein BXO88_00405 [Oribacterium sp. C9]